MKISLYSISYLGIWYDGQALDFETCVKRARDYGYDGIELDGKRPLGNPMDLSQHQREEMRTILEGEGLEISCVAANNDFSSPIPEHRECQLLMVRELSRLASDLGARVVRLFAAWPGVVMRDGIATYDLVKEVNSPWLKMCLDLPLLTSFDKEFVRQAALTVGDLQVYSHFGGEYFRNEQGQVQQKSLEFGKPLPDYAYFIELMREIGYDGYFGYELCHPVLSEGHEPLGLAYVDEQVQLASEFMGGLLK